MVEKSSSSTNISNGSMSIKNGQLTSQTNKQKVKPVPLNIPSDISAFKQQQQLQKSQQQLLGPPAAPPPAYHHQSSVNNSHIYPNATLLKSPRLWGASGANYDIKKAVHSTTDAQPVSQRPRPLLQILG